MSLKTDFQIEREVIRLYTTKTNNGWIGCNEISKKLGISKTTVQNILSRNNIETRDIKQAYEGGKRTKPIKNVPTDKPPLCKCGCKKHTAWNQRKNHWNIFIEGHYRKDLPYKDADWLGEQYRSGKTFQEIGKMFGVFGTTIKKFAKKFGIAVRPHGETLKLRGSVRGSNNPSWRGGVTPERQRAYKTDAWAELIKYIYKRDGYTCQRCGNKHNRQNKLHAHHLHSWADFPHLRLEASNLITLCDACHRWVHSRKNVNNDFIL